MTLFSFTGRGVYIVKDNVLFSHLSQVVIIRTISLTLFNRLYYGERVQKQLPMEPNAVLTEKFFIVIRGKSRKGFSRGCIGRVESRTQRGEVKGLLYSGGTKAGSPKSGGIVSWEDTYPLTRHQAQLLLFVSSASKRIELLCKPQLFTAICELSQDDLVAVKHKKGPLLGLVRNLMQIGRKESKDDLHMLGFEVEFVVGEVIFCFIVCQSLNVRDKSRGSRFL